VAVTSAKNRTGAKGADGINGSVWFSVDKKPESSIGSDNDWALDNSSGNIYEKILSVWVFKLNIKGRDGKGKKGDKGEDGKNTETIVIRGGGFSGSGSGSGGGSNPEDGSAQFPFTGLNFKHVKPDKFYLIKDDLESVVTRSQTIDGILIIDGVNTIL
jgi:hypothetical protein